MEAGGERERWNCIVVGAGSAGAVLASRLSEDPQRKVLLIEAGRDYTAANVPDEIRDVRPRAMFYTRNLWPDLRVRVQRDGPLKLYEQARIMGGGSSINGMNAPRGTPLDFNEWVAMGATGWSFDDVLPHFRRLETDLDFSSEFHGRDGPLPVRRSFPEHWPPFTRAAAEAAQILGFPYHSDHNATFGDGVYPVARVGEADARVSTSLAYLDDRVRNRPNLRVLCNTHVNRILMSGRRVTGIDAKQGGVHRVIEADEVALSAGALHSPAILLRSGIGPAGDLAALGIPVVRHSLGVGGNLQDHPFVSLAKFLPPQHRQRRSHKVQAQAFLRSTSSADAAPQDLFIFLHNKFGWHALGQRFGMLIVCLYKSRSRGRVTLRSPDPLVEPDILLDLLADPIDLAGLAAGVRLAHRLATTAPLDRTGGATFPAAYSEGVRRLNRYSIANHLKATLYASVLDLTPGLRRYLLRQVVAGGHDVDDLVRDEASLAAWIRECVAAAWHVCGTCAMGLPDNPAAVCDPRGRVYGVSGLRVVDASLMPVIVRANTNLTTIMIAEKIAAEWSSD